MRSHYAGLKIAAIASVLAAFLVIIYLSSVPTPVAGSPVTIYLNHVATGTLDNLVPLRSKLAPVFHKRHASKTGEEGFRVYLKLDPQVRVAKLVPLTDTISNAGGLPIVSISESSGTETHDSVPPDPIWLFVSTDQNAALHPDSILFPIIVDMLPDARNVRLYRVSMTNIEIGDDGKYFVNDRGKNYGKDLGPKSNTNYGGTRTLDSFTVSQHPVDDNALDTAVKEVIARRHQEVLDDAAERQKLGKKVGIKTHPLPRDAEPTEISIIVSETNTYASLLPIFRAAAGSHVTFTVIVRKAAM